MPEGLGWSYTFAVHICHPLSLLNRKGSVFFICFKRRGERSVLITRIQGPLGKVIFISYTGIDREGLQADLARGRTPHPPPAVRLYYQPGVATKRNPQQSTSPGKELKNCFLAFLQVSAALLQLPARGPLLLAPRGRWDSYPSSSGQKVPFTLTPVSMPKHISWSPWKTLELWQRNKAGKMLLHQRTTMALCSPSYPHLQSRGGCTHLGHPAEAP